MWKRAKTTPTPRLERLACGDAVWLCFLPCVDRHKPIGMKDNPANAGEDSGDFDISGDEASQY